MSITPDLAPRSTRDGWVTWSSREELQGLIERFGIFVHERKEWIAAETARIAEAQRDVETFALIIVQPPTAAPTMTTECLIRALAAATTRFLNHQDRIKQVEVSLVYYKTALDELVEAFHS